MHRAKVDQMVAEEDRRSMGGNKLHLNPHQSWFEEAAPFIGAKIVVPPHEGDPLTLERYLATKSWRRTGLAAAD
jgi:hypothetical protein